MRKLFAFSAVTVAVGAALYAGIGYWAVPHYSRQILEETVAQKLGRTVTLEAVDFNPWTWVYELRGLKIASRHGDTPLLELGLLRVDASAETITKMAPVLSELTVEGLHVLATINDENISELEKLTGNSETNAAAGTSDTPSALPAFAVYNISVKNSSFALVDTTRGIEERLTDVELALPFVSTMEAEGESLVTPKLSLKWNDTPVVAEGSTKPFGSTLEAEMHLKIDGLDVAPLAKLAPDALPEGLTLASTKVSTDTRVSFRNATGGKPAAINVSGTTSIADVALTTGSGKTLATPASLKFARVTLKSLDPVQGSVDVDDVLVRGIRVQAERNAAGVGLAGAMPKAAAQSAPAETASSAKRSEGVAVPSAWRWRLGRVNVEDVGLRLTDRTTAPAAKLAVSNFKASVENLSSEGDPGKASFSMQALGGTLNGSGTVTANPIGGNLTLNASKLALAQVSPYVKSVMGADLAGQFTMNMRAEGTPERMKLSGDASLTDLALTRAKSRMASVKSASVKIASIDTGNASAQIDRVNVTSADIRAVMTKAGLNFTEGLAGNGSKDAQGEARDAPQPASDPAPAWQWAVGTAEVRNSRLSFRDETISPAGDAALSNINVTVKNLSSKPRATSVVDVSAGLGGGTLHVAGNVSMAPLTASLDVEAQKVGLAAYGNLMRGYAGVGAKGGTLELRGRAGYAEGVPSWKGDAALTSLDLVNAKGSGLMSWKRAALTGMDIAGGTPPKIIIARAEVDQPGEKQTETVRGALGLAGIVAQLAGKESAEKKIAKAEEKLSGSIVLENIRYVDGAFSAEGISAASVGGMLLQKLSESVGGKWLGEAERPANTVSTTPKK